MAWNEIDFPKADEVSSAAAFWTLLKNDLTYLHLPNNAIYHHPGSGGNYTVTGTLGQDIDSTNFKLTITKQIESSLVVACFFGQFHTSAGSSTRVNIVHEDPQNTGRNLNYHWAVDIGYTTAVNRGWLQFFPNLPAGSHTFTAVWGDAIGTGTLEVAYRPFMAVYERGK